MQEFLEYFLQISPLWMYFWLFAGAFIENLFSPFPGDTVVVFGGYLSGIGSLSFMLVLFFTTAGSLLGFMTLFYVGKIWGTRIIESGKLINVNSPEYIKTGKWFDKYGYWVVVVNRFLAGVRTVVSIFTGISGLKPAKVAVFALISTIVWNFLLILGGFKLGENWEYVTEYIKNYNIVVLSIMFLVSAFFITKWMISKRKESNNG